MRKNKEWVERHLIPIGACVRGIRFANKFDDPQSAWLGWNKPEDMLWTLLKTGSDWKKILACLADIAERVIPIYVASFPDDPCVCNAVNSVHRCAEYYTNANRDIAFINARLADKACSDIADANTESGCIKSDVIHAALIAAQAACSVADVAFGVVNPMHTVYTVSWHTFRSVSYYNFRSAFNLDEAEKFREEERQRQRECIWKYFPVRPFLRESENQ